MTTMRLSFRLDTNDHKGLRYILLDVVHQTKRVRVSTGLTVAPKDWNKAKKRVHAKAPNAEILNMALEKILNDANAVYVQSMLQGNPFEPQMIRDHIKLGTSNKNASETLQSVFEAYCDSQLKNGVRAGSLKVYRTMFKHIRGFEKATGRPLTYAGLDAEFFDNFLAYLRGLGFVDNTVHKVVTTFKSFLKWADEKRGVKIHAAYKHRLPLRLKTESDHVALSEKELAMIEALELDSDTGMAKARDLFLLQCYTGLRYSDAVRLTSEHIQSTHIRIETVKTRQALTIGLHPHIKPILDRYDGKAPQISNQKTNKYLKDICKRAGLTEEVRRVEYRGAERHELPHPKYEGIGTHTGRRTFVTIALRKGIPSEVIRRATGHRNLRSFDSYVRVTDGIVEQEFATKWHDKI
ncbi:MAG: tyrosine-type recombinase/integrase [Candidatus Kapaibacteriota bacterium]|jgi:integrase